MDAVGNEVIHLLAGEIALVVSDILNIVKSQAESLQICGPVLGGDTPNQPGRAVQSTTKLSQQHARHWSLSPAVRAIKELAVSALFVKGIHQHTDGTPGHFHLQITASGVGALGMNSEAELFKKIPNIDELDRFNDLTDDWIVITIRGIGEMLGDKTSPDPLNRVILDNLWPHNGFDFQQPRALVRLEGGDPNSKNIALWDVMYQADTEVE